VENREFLGTIYRTLKNKWIFGDFPNFRFGGKYAVKATTVRGSRQTSWEEVAAGCRGPPE